MEEVVKNHGHDLVRQTILSLDDHQLGGLNRDMINKTKNMRKAKVEYVALSYNAVTPIPDYCCCVNACPQWLSV